MKRTIKRSYFLLTAMLVAALFSCTSKPSTDGTEEEREYDLLQRKGQWEQIVKKSQEKAVQSLACHKVVILAYYRLGKADRSALYECLSDSRQVLTSPLAALMMSDVYMQIGYVSMARRAAFEAMVKEPDIEKNERPLRRLAETAIVMGDYELALKYLTVIEAYFSINKWTKEMRSYAEHPELIEKHPTYSKLRNTYEHTEDGFFL